MDAHAFSKVELLTNVLLIIVWVCLLLYAELSVCIKSKSYYSIE